MCKGKRVEGQSRVVEPLVVCFGCAGTTNSVARSMNINIAFFARATFHSTPSFFSILLLLSILDEMQTFILFAISLSSTRVFSSPTTPGPDQPPNFH